MTITRRHGFWTVHVDGVAVFASRHFLDALRRALGDS